MKHLGAPVETRRRQLERARGIVPTEPPPEMDTDESYIFESSYTSGKVLPANFLESLLCQVRAPPLHASLPCRRSVVDPPFTERVPTPCASRPTTTRSLYH